MFPKLARLQEPLQEICRFVRDESPNKHTKYDGKGKFGKGFARGGSPRKTTYHKFKVRG